MYSAPTRSDEITVIALIPQFAPPTRPDRSTRRSIVSSTPNAAATSPVNASPALETRLGSSKLTDNRRSLCNAFTLEMPS